MSCACAVMLLFLLQGPPNDPPAKPAEKSAPAYLAEFNKLKADMDKVQAEINQKFVAAKSEAEQEAAMRSLEAKGLPLVEKALALVQAPCRRQGGRRSVDLDSQ